MILAAASAATQPDGGWPAKVALALLGLIAAAFLLDRLGLWMEKRGWIYWRKKKRDTAAAAAAQWPACSRVFRRSSSRRSSTASR